MIKIIKILKKKYQIIDPNRLGVFGWSYGGYFSLSLLARYYSLESHTGYPVTGIRIIEMAAYPV